MTEKICNCEHIDHEMDSHGFFPKNNNHTGNYRADYVGNVCDDCAETHMYNYLVGAYVYWVQLGWYNVYCHSCCAIIRTTIKKSEAEDCARKHEC